MRRITLPNMNAQDETTALRLLDEALALPDDAREAWLATRTESASVLVRLRELLAAAQASGGFLEATHAPGLTAGSAALLPAPGQRLGAWRIERELDRGGMGVVYLAHRDDGAYEQQAAIKLIHTGFWLDDEARTVALARFANERRVLARLDHHNIARVLDGGQTDSGQPYLVMEFVDGPSLIAHCERQSLSVAARIELFCKVCAGVQAAHQHLIVHRDLKPSNILVGSDGEPRLLDFGIASALEPDGASSNRTQTRFAAMTPAYASPEQLRQEPLTTASDIWSLGVILFELVTGAKPFQIEGTSLLHSERIVSSGTRASLRQALTQSEMAEPERRARLAHVGGDLERIVGKALHPEPARRYASAQALSDDLQRFLRGQPVLAHPDSAGYRLTRFLQRHRLGAALATLALAAILITSGVAFWQAKQARQASKDMQQVNAFLLDVLRLSNPFANGEELTLGQALDQATGLIDERFGQRPDLAIGIRNTLGESLQSRFLLDASQRQYQQAREEGERLFGPDDARVLTAINGLAAVRKDQNRIDDAIALYEDVLRRAERSGQTFLPVYASALNDLGVAHSTLEHNELAVTFLQRALDALSSTVTDENDEVVEENRALTILSLAQAHRALGHLDRAGTLYDEAQRVLERLHPEGSPQIAVLLNSRARLAQELSDLPAALGFQERSVAMLRESFRGDHAHTLVAIVNLAKQAIALGDLEKAEQAANEGAEMAQRLYQDTPHHYQVYALATLADLQLHRKRLPEAAQALQQARELIGKIEAMPTSRIEQVDGLIADLCALPEAASQPLCQ